MAKDPAFLFYSQDWIVGTSFLTMEERGQYITLLAMMHQHGRMTPERVGLLVGLVSVNLKEKFQVDENGCWFNERLEHESEKRSQFIEKQRINGKMGGRPKNPDLTQLKPKPKPKNNPTENENENKDINTKGEQLIFPFSSPEFLQAWEVLAKEPNWRKKTNSALQASLKKLSRHPEKVAIQMIENCIAGGWKGLVEPEFKAEKPAPPKIDFDAEFAKVGHIKMKDL